VRLVDAFQCVLSGIQVDISLLLCTLFFITLLLSFINAFSYLLICCSVVFDLHLFLLIFSCIFCIIVSIVLHFLCPTIFYE
jgi:hypothetical protein